MISRRDAIRNSTVRDWTENLHPALRPLNESQLDAAERYADRAEAAIVAWEADPSDAEFDAANAVFRTDNTDEWLRRALRAAARARADGAQVFMRGDFVKRDGTHTDRYEP